MGILSFKDSDLLAVREALDIAEDVTINFHKFSEEQWKRHCYDVKTQSSLRKHEIIHDAFALLNKGTAPVSDFESKTKKRDFYFICLQDHRILKALARDKELVLLPLLVYVLTHELVHIVRFSNFLQRFDVSKKQKDREETIVHDTTHKILACLSLPKLDYVLDSYQDHRISVTAF